MRCFAHLRLSSVLNEEDCAGRLQGSWGQLTRAGTSRSSFNRLLVDSLAAICGNMNASFRTAFWAMCLGLTVPMMLFVGVELTSGGRTSANRKAAGVMGAGSLRSQWGGESIPATAGNDSDPKGQKAPRSVRRVAGPQTQADRRGGNPRPEFRGARLSPDLEPDIEPDRPMNSINPAPWDERDSGFSSLNGALSSSASVMLDPQLEPDLQEVDDAGVVARHPTYPVSTRPRSPYVPGHHGPSGLPTSRIESQLDEIIGYLERLSAASSARSPALPVVDPMQQAADLLIRLQQARRIQDLAGQILDQPAPKEAPRPVPTAKPGPQVPAPTLQEPGAHRLQPTPVPNANEPSPAPVIVPQSNRQRKEEADDLKPAGGLRMTPSDSTPAGTVPATKAEPPIVRPQSMTKTGRGPVTTANIQRSAGANIIRQTVGTGPRINPAREKVTRKPVPRSSERRRVIAVVDGCDMSVQEKVKSPFAVAAAPQALGASALPANRPLPDAREARKAGESPFSGRRIPSNPE